MTIKSFKQSAEAFISCKALLWRDKKRVQTLKSPNIASMNIRGKGGSQNKSGVSERPPHKTNFFVYFYVLFFGIFSYFYTSAKWIIKTDDEYYY